MAKSYTNDGNKIQKSLDNYFTSNESADSMEKSITKLAGEGKWEALHGIRFMVDSDGVIMKGPDEFVGRKWVDIKDLDYLDTMNVMRNVSRAVQIVNKSMIFDPYNNFGAKQFNPRELAEKYREMARETLDKSIEKNSAARKNRKDPLYQ
jgi:hypothetical protein